MSGQKNVPRPKRSTGATNARLTEPPFSALPPSRASADGSRVSPHVQWTLSPSRALAYRKSSRPRPGGARCRHRSEPARGIWPPIQYYGPRRADHGRGQADFGESALCLVMAGQRNRFTGPRSQGPSVVAEQRGAGGHPAGGRRAPPPLDPRRAPASRLTWRATARNGLFAAVERRVTGWAYID
jgi:hypothetical protein